MLSVFICRLWNKSLPTLKRCIQIPSSKPQAQRYWDLRGARWGAQALRRSGASAAEALER